jgi:hypothetical protein
MMADKIETIFQALRGDLVTLNRAMGTLVKKLPEEDAKIMPKDYTADEALKDEALKEGVKPTSISLQVNGVVITWDISQ